LLLFGSLVDLTDNFQSLSRFIVIGDTPTQAVLENVVGYLGGLSLVATGLLRWLPDIKQLSGEAEQHGPVEAKAYESEQLLKQAARMAQLGHWVWDDINDRYLYCSEEVASLYGYSVDEYMERYGDAGNITRDIHPDDRELYDSGTGVVDLGENAYEMVYRERVRSGEYRHFREYGQHVCDETGRPVRTIGFNQDITQYKETEKALEQERQQAEAENQAKAQFLSETADVMSAMAQGNLGKRIEGDYTGSFASLKDDTNRMGDQIRLIASQITGASTAVQHATGEIASGVTDLSLRTEHQASSLEETTASMEELSATVRQNAINAQEASQMAAAARESATSGGEVVGEVVNAMSRIEDSSKQITEIVGLIQEIAFQTNLLALNAAVEAARAGDAGKGFAVVANEVRALAQRAGQASKDIQDLITNSDNQVLAGVDLVNRAGQSLGDIVTSVKQVADFVAEIAAASHEQSSGIDQVSRAINSMEEMTQQNGALVEQTTAALQSAESQVDDLRKIVTFFKTGEKSSSRQAAELPQEQTFKTLSGSSSR
ncbi:MAG: methyl-accepting chemotaxis protein, partial [Hyphomicrobiales bacterium]|nr:methyl-accepting chemotaxis protein [Hyphomicrobiales bacterium]